MTPASLCSQAFYRLGASGITSFQDGTVEALLARQLYPTIVASLLASYPWSFALKQALLSAVMQPPTAPFTYTYALPSEVLRALSLEPPGTRYRLYGQHLCTNKAQARLNYVALVSESLFPSFFVACLVARLTAEFCLPITASTSRSSLLFELADKEMRTARSLDSQQNTPQRLEDFSLVNVRGH